MSGEPGGKEAGLWPRFIRWWLSPAALVFGTAGLLAGYYLMWNVELQMIWLVAVCLPSLVATGRKQNNGLTRNLTFRVAMVFLAWNLGVGIARNHEAFADYYTWEFLAGSLALPVYLGALWTVCRRPAGTPVLLQTIIWSATVAAAGALGWWWFVQCAREPGARLRNPFVHGGQHPVGTAIMLGFAATAAAISYGRAHTRLRRAVLLGSLAVISLAVFLTLSRGGLLALAGAGMIYLPALLAEVILRKVRRSGSLKTGDSPPPLSRFWSEAWPPLLTVAVMFAAFQMLARIFAPVAFVPEEGTGFPPAYILTDRPAQEYIARGDSGRGNFYRLGFACVDTWDRVLTGAGLWKAESKLEMLTAGDIDHLHSLYVATWVHGGVIGTLLLAVLIAGGLRGAWVLLRAGQPHWLGLLGYGLAAHIFDGQSLCSLVTHPRFENLILWFPLIAIAAGVRNLREAQAGRQPSSSESK